MRSVASRSCGTPLREIAGLAIIFDEFKNALHSADACSPFSDTFAGVAVLHRHLPDCLLTNVKVGGMGLDGLDNF